MSKSKVLVVDDEPGVRFGIKDFLDSKGYEVEEAESTAEAMERFQDARPDAVLVDYMLHDGNALQLLPALKSILPELESAQLQDFFVTREREATFRPSPGTAQLRPAARTSAPGLYLAGAWTATEWPATMEGAVRSGDAAAAALLADASSFSTEAA